MTEDLYVSRFYMLKKALKSKWNLFCLSLGVLFLADWLTGGSIMEQILLFQYKLRGIDVNVPRFRVLTFFGTYRDINLLARTFDKFFALFFLITTGLSYGKGLLSGLMNK